MGISDASETEKFFTEQTVAVSTEKIHFYISKRIASPDNYIPMIHRIVEAPMGSTVNIHLNSRGGNIDSTVQIVAAMRASKARVVTSVEGIVASAAAILFLAGTERLVSDHSTLMLHSFSAGLYGKGHELTSGLGAIKAQFEGMMADICIPFITKRELDSIREGKDYYFQADEIRERLLRTR